MSLTLLMLAPEFPPLAAVGVQRTVKLAKYLPEWGVTPVVVTADAASQAAWFGRRIDESPLTDLPPGTQVEHVPAPRVQEARGPIAARWAQFTSLGDGFGAAWAPALRHIWDGLVRRSHASAVYVSMPPFSAAPVALDLARHAGLPLVLDFRDHWSQWCHVANPTWWHYRRKLLVERRCVEGASAVLGVTRQLVTDLQRAHPMADRARFHVVPNGFDGVLPDERARPSQRADGARPFVFGYAGSFYYAPGMRDSVMRPWWEKSPRHWLQYTPRQEDWRYRSPFYFFRGLRRALDERPDLRDRIRVRFAGDKPEWFDEQVTLFDLAGSVEHVGRLDHAACVAFEASCDALLVTSVKVVDGRDYCIAGKTFEYLTSGRPILGIVTEGEQRDFLRAAGGAIIADADDEAGCARAIASLTDGAPAEAIDRAFLDAFHRRETARRVADILRALVPRARASA